MQRSESDAILDREQLRDVTLDDGELMREIVAALIDDVTRQLPLLEAAVRDRDSRMAVRLAHYSKGACANVGARAAAAALLSLERGAERADFIRCAASLAALAHELERLRAEASDLCP